MDNTRHEEVSIGLAHPQDLAFLPQVELDAATLFADLDVPESVLATATDAEDFVEAQQRGLLWVARAGGVPVGFALVELLGGAPHLEEMDVRPAFGRRGVGARLLRAVLAWARGAGHAAVTLTTFRDLPWNAPFYAQHGFREMAEHELSPPLRALVADEIARGLDPATRVTMVCRFAG
jgi:GNAT superfamily N-acetyltransferase